MIEVRLYDGKDTETIALFPGFDDAVAWVRAAYVDTPGAEGDELCGGDIYAYDPDTGQRTLLLTDGAILTLEQMNMLRELTSITAWGGGMSGEGRRRAAAISLELRTQLGIVERYEPGWRDPRGRMQ